MPLKFEFSAKPWMYELEIRSDREWGDRENVSVVKWMYRKAAREGLTLNINSLVNIFHIDNGYGKILLVYLGRCYEHPQDGVCHKVLRDGNYTKEIVAITFPHGMENIQKALDNPTNLG